MIKLSIYSKHPYSGREYGFFFSIVDQNKKPIEELLYHPVIE
mgnify:CR=1 FL=1